MQQNDSSVITKSQKLNGASRKKLSSQDRFRKLKDDFLSLAAHEIRTPITVIKAQAQLAERFYSQGKFQGEIVERSLRIFVQESDRLARLCTDLLDIARIDNGSFEVRFSFFDLNELVRDIVEKVRNRFGQESVFYRSCGSTAVFADSERTHQVLMNLLMNAIRYSPDGGDIEVRLETLGQEARVSVKDHGLGISADQLNKVFERYYHAESLSLKSPGGLGIGLYLCGEIVRRMNGAIDVRSEGLGCGAEFSFTVPLKGDENG